MAPFWSFIEMGKQMCKEIPSQPRTPGVLRVGYRLTRLGHDKKQPQMLRSAQYDGARGNSWRECHRRHFRSQTMEVSPTILPEPTNRHAGAILCWGFPDSYMQCDFPPIIQQCLGGDNRPIIRIMLGKKLYFLSVVFSSGGGLRFRR